MKFLPLLCIIVLFFSDVITAKQEDAISIARLQMYAAKQYLGDFILRDLTFGVYFVKPDTMERLIELDEQWKQYEIKVIFAKYENSYHEIYLEADFIPKFDDGPVQKRVFKMFKSRLSQTDWMLFDKP